MAAPYRSRPRFAKSRWNSLVGEGVAMGEHIKRLCVDELMTEGLPPLTDELSESAEYHRLVTLALANDPRYMRDVGAKRRLAELALRYGPPPEMPIPIGQRFPIQPGAEAAAMQ